MPGPSNAQARWAARWWFHPLKARRPPRRGGSRHLQGPNPARARKQKQNRMLLLFLPLLRRCSAVHRLSQCAHQQGWRRRKNHAPRTAAAALARYPRAGFQPVPAAPVLQRGLRAGVLRHRLRCERLHHARQGRGLVESKGLRGEHRDRWARGIPPGNQRKLTR